MKYLDQKLIQFEIQKMALQNEQFCIYVQTLMNSMNYPKPIYQSQTIKQQRQNQIINMKNYKFSELKSTSSTLQSTVGTPQSILTLNSLGTKKFARKRDSSNESLRRNVAGHTPKSNNGSIAQKQQIDKKPEKVEDLNMSKIIKTNSYIKWFQSPISRKASQISQPSSTRPQHQCNIHSSNPLKQKTQAIQKMQNSYQTPKNKQYNRVNQKSFQNFRVLNSTSNASRSRKQIQPQHTTYNVYNYSQPQTQRQLYSGIQKTDNSVEIKVLQNQIMILQDENARLKKQISQLNCQKDQQQKKRLQIQNQLKQLQKKVNQMQNSQKQVIKVIKDSIHQIYLQIIEQFHLNTNQNQVNERQRKFFNLEVQSPTKSRQQANKSKLSQYANMDEFIKVFIQPAREIIHQNIKKYGKILQSSQLNINKMQIKQNIMMRGSFELENIKHENKLLNEQVKTERDRSKKFKDQYEKLKKQNNQIKKTSTISKNKTFSQSFIGASQKSKNSSNSQEFVSLILSDGSDDQYQNSRNKRSRKQ